ncbi:radical SAM family heme chaperone HemW [Campylobacter sp. 2018MI13]|uniref:radical SAM family heme chaperone HemW n=1 Tax=Campylobacter sp. 2018MI13 TaxID=2836737 RepID=UPI001BDAB22D|nr:radical SAM family heme chaperone HemW [Campylobacter sp. 2018MI13]MBT0882213.1 coproporphyrinogen III oxidase family protein [Campylobacter sp. 2018MI13]
MRIYIHIPFCASKCSYCSFASFTNQQKINEYFKALELDLARFLPFSKDIKSIYFGGGTPSFIDAKYYENIFKLLKPYINNDTEISAEANPNSLSLNWLNTMRNYGLNRISIGVQSFNDEKLKFLNRAHSSKQAIEKIKLLKNEKISFSIDIIYGTYLDDLNMLNDELKVIKSLELNHLSAYTLILEDNTPFQNKTEYIQKDDELNCYFYENLQKIGLKAYEISNFVSSSEYECSHNKAYWSKENYLGIGLSSVGTSDNIRYTASSNLNEYIANPYFRIKESLSPNDIRLESIFLGLRSNVGVDINLIKDKKKLDDLKDLVFIKDNKVFNKNYLISDEIALYLE